MKQGKIAAAYNDIVEMYGIQGAPYDVYVILLRVKRDLQVYVDCQSEQEEKIADEISGGMIADGTYPMNQEQQRVFMTRIREIQKTEVSYDKTPETLFLTAEQIRLLGITGRVMDNLDGIINIVKIDEGGEEK